MRNTLKIEDQRIASNHSWRHTFKTIYRNQLEPPTREDTVNHIGARAVRPRGITGFMRYGATASNSKRWPAL
jgi:hypothetical protein